MQQKNLRVHLIPIFEDNYVFIIQDDESREALIVDPGESEAPLQYLRENNLRALGILITHHHHDHIGGVLEIKKQLRVRTYAPSKNRIQIPFADEYINENDLLSFGDFYLKILELPGHTLGHVAFWNPQRSWLFSGDVLFGLGCGRLFEGTPEQAYTSLQKIKTLPPESLIFCTHEYTEANLRFCQMLSQREDSLLTEARQNLQLYANELKHLRALKVPSVPLKLHIEMRVNPFLTASDVEQFTALRELRNRSVV